MVGFLRSIDRSYKRFYSLLIGTQAFSHFIQERSFGCDRLGTLTSRRSGDLAFFDECVQQIDDYNGETSFIEFDDVLPPRSLVYIHTHTHLFNGPLSGTTQVSRYQKGKTNLDFVGARDSEWQWHQLGHMQVCTLLQTDDHASTSLLNFFYRPGALSATNQQRQSREHISKIE